MMLKKSNHHVKDELKQKGQQQKTPPRTSDTGLTQNQAKPLTTQDPNKKIASQTPSQERKKGPTTRITIKYDVGFNNAVYLRGKGANLSWDKGVLLKNVKNDEWFWETDQLFTTCEFKVLINDNEYELGENHPLSCGAAIQYTPKFKG